MLKYKHFIWKPQEDITAYELALCLKLIIAQLLQIAPSTIYEGLPESCKRHIHAELNKG